MKTGPDMARVAALVGDPARANMLTALMSGRALTAGELAQEAGVSLPTASAHLAKMRGNGLIVVEKQGRHRYFRLSGPDVAVVLEGLMGLAARVGHLRTRIGPRDAAMRNARVCYDHLAGVFGVQMYDSMKSRRLIGQRCGEITLTDAGQKFVAGLGVDLAITGAVRRPLCRACLDWSVRRHHLAGALGAALLRQFFDQNWARRENASRAINFTRHGERRFKELFGAPPIDEA
jgi:DNA-binding transcriptional ArsR family regulator